MAAQASFTSLCPCVFPSFFLIPNLPLSQLLLGPDPIHRAPLQACASFCALFFFYSPNTLFSSEVPNLEVPRPTSLRTALWPCPHPPPGFLLTVTTNVAAAPQAAVEQHEADEQPEPPEAPGPQRALHPPGLAALLPHLSRRDGRQLPEGLRRAVDSHPLASQTEPTNPPLAAGPIAGGPCRCLRLPSPYFYGPHSHPNLLLGVHSSLNIFLILTSPLPTSKSPTIMGLTC